MAKVRKISKFKIKHKWDANTAKNQENTSVGEIPKVNWFSYICQGISLINNGFFYMAIHKYPFNFGISTINGYS